MMKKKFILVALTLSGISVWGRPQFYIGLQSGVNLSKHVHTLGNQGWNNLLLQAYAPSLEGKTKSWVSRVKKDANTSTSSIQQTPPYWILTGTPKNLFQDLLDDKTAEMSRQHLTSFDILATLGAYLFRHEKMLFAAEFFIGVSSFSSKQEHQQSLLDAEIPAEILDAYQKGLFKDESSTGGRVYDLNKVDLNPAANSLRPYMYVRPEKEIQAKNDVEVTARFLCGGNIRLGTIIKDRVFLYALLGGQGERFLLTAALSLDSSLPPLLVFYYASSYASAYDDDVTFGLDEIEPDPTVGTSPKLFKTSKMKWGVTGGLGLEFYINHRFALRTDVTMTYYTDIKMKAKDGESLMKLTHKPWRIGLGLVYRFS